MFWRAPDAAPAQSLPVQLFDLLPRAGGFVLKRRDLKALGENDGDSTCRPPARMISLLRSMPCAKSRSWYCSLGTSGSGSSLASADLPSFGNGTRGLSHRSPRVHFAGVPPGLQDPLKFKPLALNPESAPVCRLNVARLAFASQSLSDRRPLFDLLPGDALRNSPPYPITPLRQTVVWNLSPRTHASCVSPRPCLPQRPQHASSLVQQTALPFIRTF